MVVFVFETASRIRGFRCEEVKRRRKERLFQVLEWWGEMEGGEMREKGHGSYIKGRK